MRKRLHGRDVEITPVGTKTSRPGASSAERALLAKEEGEGHRDIVTELGFTLKQPIPKGEAFIEWIADEKKLVLVLAVLRSRNFTWEEIREGIFDLTRWRWLPSIEQLQLTYEKAKD